MAIEWGFASADASTHMPDLDGSDLFHSGSWYRRFATPCGNIPTDPRSDAIMGAFTSPPTIQLDFAASSKAGGNSVYTFPVAVVGPDCPRFTIPKAWMAYGNESDPGPYPVPPACQNLAPLSQAKPDTDYDLVVLVTDAAGSKVEHIYEYYQLHRIDGYLGLVTLNAPSSPPIPSAQRNQLAISANADGTYRFRVVDSYDNVTVDMDAGAAVIKSMLAVADAALDPKVFVVNGVAHFDLTTGIARPEGWTSASGGGMSKFLGLIRYDEIKRGVIPHTLRVCVDAGNATKRFVSPGRHGIGGWAADDMGLPMGARLRIKPAWYAAHAAEYTGQARIILDALANYGAMVDDIEISSTRPLFAFQGVADDGLIQSDLAQITRIPGTAWEVCQLNPAYTVSVPASVPLGSEFAATFTIDPTKDDASGRAYFMWDGATISVDMDTGANRTVVIPLAATKVGAQKIDILPTNNSWHYPPSPIVQVIDPATAPPPIPPHG